MLRYILDDADLGGLRFGISPLCELGLSLRSLAEPSRYPLQLPWLRHTEEARKHVDTAMLGALINEKQWTPDFLNPRPESPLTRIEDEFRALRAMEPEHFLKQIRSVHEEVPAPLAGDPERAIARMADTLEHYWLTCFEPYWGRMRAILEADIVYRGRQIAQSGLAVMLNGLGETVSFANGVLEIALKVPGTQTASTAGFGITLVPTMFTRRGSAPVDNDEPPMLMYPARGQGVLWEAQRVADGGTTLTAVAEVLGRVRTALLAALAEPASSTELGVRFGVSASAVNQHLRALRGAGLVTSTRYGHSVLYLRSELGDRLLNLSA